jgi:hypothetical protein
MSKFFILTLILLQCIYIYTYIAYANVLGHVNVSVNIIIICEVTLSLGLLSPQTFFERASIKYGNFIKFGNEMLKFSI